MGGFVGRILEVDLSAGQTTVKDLEAEVVQNFLGGRGLGIKLLYDAVGPNVDPLSPDNNLIIATGVLSGTSAPSNGRTDVVTKSPLSGVIGTGNFGGYWGPRLRFSGFEGVVVRGESDRPVYLWIDEGVAQLRSAEHLWGKDTYETTEALQEELGDDVSVLAIGPAGENLVKFACPIADYDHAPGRSHAGCVMGAKKLKAIAVRGTRKMPIADPIRFRKITKECMARIAAYPMASPPESGLRPEVGSHYWVQSLAIPGMLPARNFQATSKNLSPNSDIFRPLPDAVEGLIKKRPGYGYQCPMEPLYGCSLAAEIKEGKYAGIRVGGLNFAFPPAQTGVNLGVESYPAMYKFRELCQRYGMDMKTPIAFAMELFEKGIITKEDLGGLELTYGNEEAIFNMLAKIAYRQGFGDVLADGSVRAAKKIGKGAERAVMTIKGTEIAFTDPRGLEGWANILATVTCARGGDDLHSTHALVEGFPGWARENGWSEEEYLQWFVDYLDMSDEEKREIFGVPPRLEAIHLDATEGKAARVIYHEKLSNLFNSLGLCLMTGNSWSALGATHYAELYSACTGWETTPEEMRRTGDRIFHLIKAYNVREGLTRKDDEWPARFYEEPIADGVAKGTVLSREKMEGLLDEYYELRGWDKTKGVPTREKLVELGLDYVADELSRLGRI